MEITYKRDLKHNYLIVVPEEALYAGYEIRMMASNCIEGLLKFHVKQVDDRKSYYYEITSKQPLNRLLDCQPLGAEELHSLMSGVIQTLERMEMYLLQDSQILLQPDFIYVEPEGFTVHLCLVPGRQGAFPKEMTALLQYLLGKVNHQDKESVVLAYGLYQESLRENYGMIDLMRLIARDYKADRDDVRARAKHIEEKTGQAVGVNSEKNTNRNAEIKASAYKEAEQEEKGEKQKERERKAFEAKDPDSFARRGDLTQSVLAFCIIFFGGPALCWLLYGGDGLRGHWLIFLVLDVSSAVILIIRMAILALSKTEQSSRRISNSPPGWQFADIEENGGNHRGEGSQDWQMLFQDESEKAEMEEGQKKGIEINSQIEDCSTVLLTEACAPPNSRYLHSMENDIEDIVIAYVPFLIGKQEGLVDYVLSCDTVSRLHARIDREGEAYRITDLNSTNGITVRGRLLEMNEVAALSSGDEVYIANKGFIFT